MQATGRRATLEGGAMQPAPTSDRLADDEARNIKKLATTTINGKYYVANTCTLVLLVYKKVATC
jgi:hypothetical protein